MPPKLKKISFVSKKIYKAPKKDMKNVKSMIKRQSSMEKKNFVKAIKQNQNEKLLHYAINKGIIIYGQITKVTETEILVNLPENRRGNVSIVRISESYKAQLKKSLDPTTEEDVTIHSLPTLFKVGQNIYCRQIKQNGRFSELSLVPQEINQQIKYNFIESGFKFYGAIKQKNDDNEYLIETGIRHFKGIFKCSDEKLYCIGDFIYFCVSEIINSSTLSVEANLRVTDENDSDERDEATLNFYNTVPGTKVQYMITKITNNCITGTILFNETITAVLLANNSTTLAVNDMLLCKIVCIEPSHRIVYLQQDQDSSNSTTTVQHKSGDMVEINILGVANNTVSYQVPEYNISSKGKSYDLTPILLGSKLTCKIFDTSISGIQLTNRLEYFFADKNILSKRTEAIVGEEYYGTVIREFDNFYVIRFFDGITGTLSNKFIDKSQFYIGKIGKFCINGLSEKLDKKQIYLKLAEMNDEPLGSVISDAIVLSHNPYSMQVQLNQYDNSQIGYIPVGTLTNDMELDRILFSFFKDGSTIDCVQIDRDIYKISNEDAQKHFEDIEEGDIIKGYIKNIINGKEVEIFAPIKHTSKQSIILPFVFNKLHFNYFFYKSVFLKVFEKHTENSTISYGITNLETIWNGDLNTSIDKFENYLIYYSQVLEQLGYSLGDKIEGTIIEIGKENAKINFGSNETGVLEISSKSHVINQKISTFLSSLTYTNENQLIYNFIEKSKKIIKNSNLEENSSFDCEIVLIKPNFVIARSVEVRAPLIYIPKFVHENDFNCIMSNYFKVNSTVKITYLRKFNDTIGIGLPTKFYKKYTKKNVVEQQEVATNIENADGVSELFVPSKRLKIKHNDEFDSTEISNIPSVSNLWDLNLKSVCAKPLKEDDDNDSDENDSTKKKTENKPVKLTPVERREAVKQEEARIREIEEKLADTNRLPETVDEYERLLLATPNDSSLWIKYMAFHLQSTEIDKARKVCHQGLKTISYREESDKLNLWLALLNLEVRYGSNEQFQTQLNEALKVNDQFTVYTKSLDILFNSKKLDELGEMIEKVRRKFGKTHKQIWIHIASIYFQLGENQKAVKLLGRAMTSLPERDHVDTIIQFAVLMNKNNESSQAHAHLEQILNSYPKRIDVWCLYVDMLIKSNLLDAARNTLDRGVNQKLNVKKMKTLFKKYLEFEKMYGTEMNVNKVKQLAEEYVEAKVQNN